MPHNGELLMQQMKEKHYSQSDLARALNTQLVTIYRMVKRQSIGTDYLWKLGELMNVNFFSILAQSHPANTLTPKEIELEKQVSDLQKEVAIYKELLKR